MARVRTIQRTWQDLLSRKPSEEPAAEHLREREHEVAPPVAEIAAPLASPATRVDAEAVPGGNHGALEPEPTGDPLLLELRIRNVIDKAGARQIQVVLAALPEVLEATFITLLDGVAYYSVYVRAAEEVLRALVSQPHVPLHTLGVAGDGALEGSLCWRVEGEDLPAWVSRGGARAMPAAAAEEIADAPRPVPMFELGAETFFNARHYVVLNGQQGQTHPHSWRVRVSVRRAGLDTSGVAVTSATIVGEVKRIVAPYNDVVLNAVPPFDKLVPTLENVALVIYDDLKARLAGVPVQLSSVTVWETPTIFVRYSEAGYDL